MNDESPHGLPGVPLIDSPRFETEFAGTDPELRRIATSLRQDGFAVFDFPEPDLDALDREIRETLAPKFDFERWRATLWKQADGLRLQDAWQECDAVRRIACNQAVLDLLERLYGRAAFPFQTLNFPVGTQQHFHSDSVFFSSVPNAFMCGVWLALEDIDADNGPLVYYPGSHRVPMVTNDMIGRCGREESQIDIQDHLTRAWRDLAEAHGFERAQFHAKKGQAIIWAAHLLHGGAPHRDNKRTRWSQVTHYYFEDCVYWTPVESDVFAGSVSYREPFDVLSGGRVPNSYLGEPVDRDWIKSVLPPFNHLSDDVPARAPKPTGRSISRLRDTRDRVAARTIAKLKGFDGEAYLDANPDVREGGMDPLTHWVHYGYRENRPLR